MKELTIEQKAKAYDDALGRALKLRVQNPFDTVGQMMEYVFPELAESEDEKIRKEILVYIDKATGCERWVAWLEKQGDKDKLIKELGEYKVKYTQEVLGKFMSKDDERLRKTTIEFLKEFADKGYENAVECIGWLENPGFEPNWCHHKVDLSNCPEEYRKAYYDGWNNCNMQHSQCKAYENDVVKCLINGMKFYYEDNEEATWGTKKFSMKVKDILYWLERQGEHLENFDEAEKEKSDFVGDGFIKCFANFLDFKEGETYWLEYIGDDKYNVRSDNLLGKTYHITPCQLYTVFKKLTWLEKQDEQKSIWHNEDEEPQRGSLILLIMQSGTPIVAKIIEPNHTFNHGERWAYIDDLLEKQSEQILTNSTKTCKVEQKPAWSEDDKKMIWAIHLIIKSYPNQDMLYGYSKEKLISWIESFKERVLPQSQQDWSEEDEKLIDIIISDLERHGGKESSCYSSEINYLKSLKDRISPKQEWTEEDEKVINDIMWIIEAYRKNGFNETHIQMADNSEKWLKSIKSRVQPKREWNEEDEREVAVLEAYIRSKDWSERHIDRALGIVDELVNKAKSLRPQNAWKPSDEQIKVCKEVYADLLSAKGFDVSTINSDLNRLEEQLKKLREE